MSPPPRLGFVLPDFARHAWVSDPARSRWQPRLERVARAWSELEWRSVAGGLRQAALTTVSQHALLDASQRWLEAGLSWLPVAHTAGAASGYASTAVPARLGAASELRVVVGRRRHVLALKEAFVRCDDDGVGRLLGYPDCCRAFFREVWQQAGCVDTTWAMAGNTREPHGRTVVLDPPAPYANVLLRWIGVRAVPHLPCRFDCDGTLRFGERLVEHGREIGLGEEMRWLLEMLSWPVGWSALHGIAEIKTPIMKILARTDATAERYDVHLRGPGHPEEGAFGLGFPYRSRDALPLTRSRAFLRGLANPITPRAASGTAPRPRAAVEPGADAPQEPAWHYRDNGFTSRQAMDASHAPIVELAVQSLQPAEPRAGARAVLDLGCGNGLLLRRICERAPGCVPFGVDLAAEAIAHALELQPDHRDRFAARDLFDGSPWPGESEGYALVLLMAGRLLEVDPPRARALVARVLGRSRRLLLYVYPGYSSERFISLLERAGLARARLAEGPWDTDTSAASEWARTRVALVEAAPEG